MASLKENIIKDLLTQIGEDSNREGLLDTPKRVVKSWETLFGGYKQFKEFLSVSLAAIL